MGFYLTPTPKYGRVCRLKYHQSAGDTLAPDVTSVLCQTVDATLCQTVQQVNTLLKATGWQAASNGSADVGGQKHTGWTLGERKSHDLLDVVIEADLTRSTDDPLASLDPICSSLVKDGKSVSVRARMILGPPQCDSDRINTSLLVFVELHETRFGAWQSKCSASWTQAIRLEKLDGHLTRNTIQENQLRQCSLDYPTFASASELVRVQHMCQLLGIELPETTDYIASVANASVTHLAQTLDAVKGAEAHKLPGLNGAARYIVTLAPPKKSMAQVYLLSADLLPAGKWNELDRPNRPSQRLNTTVYDLVRRSNHADMTDHLDRILITVKRLDFGEGNRYALLPETTFFNEIECAIRGEAVSERLVITDTIYSIQIDLDDPNAERPDSGRVYCTAQRMRQGTETHDHLGRCVYQLLKFLEVDNMTVSIF